MKEYGFGIYDDYITSCDKCGKETKELYVYGAIEVCEDCLFELDEDF